MLICVKCKKEMKVKKNGVVVKYNEGHHCYSSDVYECKDCGATIALTNNNSFHVEFPVEHPSDIIMED